MAGYILEFRGCTPEPLGNYLKGLGVFRLIAEQADPLARAWWKDGFLHILQNKWDDSGSTSREDKLADWLLKACRFTPFIAPWQTGTGYLPLGKRSAGGDALQALLAASHPGTNHFRDAFRDFAATRGAAIGNEPSKWLDEVKQSRTDVPDAELHRTLRNRVRLTAPDLAICDRLFRTLNLLWPDRCRAAER